MNIVPLGVDCSIALYLKEKNIRNFALPFDYIVSQYPGKQIINNFNTFFDDNDFPHHDIKNDDVQKTFIRRINRLYDLFTSNNFIYLLRKSHQIHHHLDEKLLQKITLEEDINDLFELKKYLEETYKTLKFKIIFFIVCDKCNFVDVEKYNCDNFEIIDIVKIHGKGNTTCSEKRRKIKEIFYYYDDRVYQFIEQNITKNII